MKKEIYYEGSYPFKYYLTSILLEKSYEVSEKEFFEVIGFDRSLVPMKRDKNNINRQNFFLDNDLIGYRERK